MPFPTTVDAIVDAPPVTAATRIFSSQVLGPQRITVGPTQYNVKSDQYGAIGDGVTNDTVAIQAALTAAGNAGGGIVYMPSATYLLGPNFQTGGSTQVCLGVPDNVLLMGAGGITTLKLVANASNASALWMLMGSKNFNSGGARVNTGCSVQNLIFDGNTANQAPAAGITHSGVVFWPVNNHYLANVTVQNLAGAAGTEHFGIFLNGDTAGNDTVITRVNGVVHACRATNCGSGFAFHSLMGEVVSDCISTSNTTFMGFTVWTAAALPARVRDISILGCIADSCQVGFELEGAMGVKILGCIARNNQNSGIRITSNAIVGSQRCVVIGNECYNNNQSASTGIDANGITLAIASGFSPTDNLIVGNRCYDDQSVQTQRFGIGQDAIAAGSQNSVINNNCRNNKIGNTTGLGGLFQNATQSATLNLSTVATVPTGMTVTFTVDADSLVIVNIQGMIAWDAGTANGTAGDYVQADLRVDSVVKISNQSKCAVTATGQQGLPLSWAQTLAAGSHTIDMQIANQTGNRGQYGRGNIAVQIVPFQQ